ncbi:MAG: hypothetical protein K9H64_23690 [Bacteroidales bacterium]|nr:hypothetical protein [Bacteroidales bacterium]MCF8459055.1 hypothetical protein [Bacteroidales bacterium]
MKVLILTLSFLFLTTHLLGQDSDPFEIQEIRAEFQRIESDFRLNMKQVEFFDQSTDGAELSVFSDQSGAVRKISVIYFGETGKFNADYYLKNNKLFFAFSQRHEYNRPYYWDEKAAIEFEDTVVFDISKTKIFENRYYFNSDLKLIRWIDENKKTIELDSVLIDKQGEVLLDLDQLINRIDE